MNVGKTWEKKKVQLPERKKYVKYTQNYRSRAIVDFDKGDILVETVDDQDPRRSLKNAIVTTLLTPQDPRSVDLFSDKEIVLTGDKEPYLLGLVLDQQGKAIRTPTEAEPFAEHVLTSKSGTRDIDQEGMKKTATYVTIKMAANLSQKQAEKYRPVVQQFAEQYKISSSLVFAIIRTESNFNPLCCQFGPGLRTHATGPHQRWSRSLPEGERQGRGPLTGLPIRSCQQCRVGNRLFECVDV